MATGKNSSIYMKPFHFIQIKKKNNNNTNFPISIHTIKSITLYYVMEREEDIVSFITISNINYN